jgi:hypothetical protein
MLFCCTPAASRGRLLCVALGLNDGYDIGGEWSCSALDRKGEEEEEEDGGKVEEVEDGNDMFACFII